jgi:hypothetical protein
MMRKTLIILLILLTLACNFPGFPDILSGKKVTEPSPEVLPKTEETDIKVDEPEQDDNENPDVDTGSPTSTPTLTPTATETPKPTSTDSALSEPDPTATDTPTPTATPTATAKPVVKPTATTRPTDTSTPTNTPKVGPPMTFADPAWELVEWHKLGDTGEWEGTIRARITGGTSPYRSRFENQDIVNGLDMPVRWRLCKPMPATIRVISADGQDIHIGIWVYEVGCP